MFDDPLHALRRGTACAAAILAIGCAAAAPAAAEAATVYDNLASSRDGSDPVFGFGPLADSFTTGATGGVLGSVSALLTNSTAGVVGSIEITLRANGANAPGAPLLSLGTLSSAAIPTTGFTVETFQAPTSFMLAASTTYWIEITSVSPTGLEWSWSNDLSATGVAGQSNYSATLGSGANAVSPAYQMSVAVQAVPEPSTVAVLVAGLGGLGLVTRRRPRAPTNARHPAAA